MKCPPYLVAVAAVLGLVLAGCQPTAGPPTVGSSAAVPEPPSSSELVAIIQEAVEDRNGTVLDSPPAARLAAGDDWQLDVLT